MHNIRHHLISSHSKRLSRTSTEWNLDPERRLKLSSQLKISFQPIEILLWVPRHPAKFAGSICFLWIETAVQNLSRKTAGIHNTAVGKLAITLYLGSIFRTSFRFHSVNQVNFFFLVSRAVSALYQSCIP